MPPQVALGWRDPWSARAAAAMVNIISRVRSVGGFAYLGQQQLVGAAVDICDVAHEKLRGNGPNSQ